jgi:hypothetical protein
MAQPQSRPRAADAQRALGYTPIQTFPTEQVCAAFIRSEEFVADLKELAEKLGGGEFKVKCVAAPPPGEET